MGTHKRSHAARHLTGSESVSLVEEYDAPVIESSHHPLHVKRVEVADVLANDRSSLTDSEPQVLLVDTPRHRSCVRREHMIPIT